MICIFNDDVIITNKKLQTRTLRNICGASRFLVQLDFVHFAFVYCSVEWETLTRSKADATNKDWVFLNYTFKRFEGLTQRGVRLPPM